MRYETSYEPLHDELRYLGFNVIIKKGHDQETGKQKEVDMEMGVQMVLQASRNEYDTAIMILGDRDFLPAVNGVKSRGKRVEGAGFSGHTSKKLVKGCNAYRLLDDIPIFYIDPMECAHIMQEEIYPVSIQDLRDVGFNPVKTMLRGSCISETTGV